jgi:uncharacterized membrane protein
MKVRHFLSTVEHDRIHQAIQSAELGTSGRIVLFISHRHVADPVDEAHQLFIKQKLETEGEKTGLLILLAPRSQKFAVVGGTALHAKLGQAWWDHLAATLGRRFKEGLHTDGLLEAIAEIGTALQAHFPSRGSLPPRGADIVEQ